MKILREYDSTKQISVGDTVYVNMEIDKIIDVLDDSKCVIGDDNLQLKGFIMAKELLDDLIEALQDENKHVIYFHGNPQDIVSMKEKLKRRNRHACVNK